MNSFPYLFFKNKAVKNSFIAICFLSFFVLCLPAFANINMPSQAELDMLFNMNFAELRNVEIVSSTGSKKTVHLAPSIARVITSDEIEAMGAITLDDILETIAGLHVAPSNEAQMDSVYSIRGIHTSLNQQVLVLINDVPISAHYYTGGKPTFFKMPVNNISRIEVIRGPGSSVHGADAFAGLINIFTKDYSEIDGTDTGIIYGSFETYDLWIQHGGQYKGWDVALSLEFQKSDGDKDRILDSDLQSSFDSIFGTNASLAPGPLDLDYELWNSHMTFEKDNWRFNLWGLVQPDGKFGDGVTQTLVYEDASKSKTKHFLGDVIYNKNSIFVNTDLNVRFSYLYHKEDTLLTAFPSGAILPIGSDGNLFTGGTMVVFSNGVTGRPVKIGNQTGIHFTLFNNSLNDHNIRLGTGYEHIKGEFEETKNFGTGVLDNPTMGMVVDGTLTDVTGTPFIFMPDETRNVWYLSLQDEWKIVSNWELTYGVRYDRYSDFGKTINPRAALVWEKDENLIIKLLYGSAFRPPSFLELYDQNNPSNVGNEDLEPETIDTLELAFDYHPTQNLHFLFSPFIYEINDIIDFETLPSGISLNQNVRDQKGHGFEFEAAWEITNKLRIRTNLAYQRSKDKSTNEIVPDAPELQFYTNAYWKILSESFLNIQYYWIGNRQRAAGDVRPEIKDNDIVNLSLRRKNIFQNWDLALLVKNVFDEDVREPSQPTIPNDYPMDSRSFWVEIRKN